MAWTSNILNKSILRTTKSNWKQFLAIVCMGTLALTLFIGLLSNYVSFSSRVESYYEAGDMADMWVLTTSPTGADASDIKSYLDDDDTFDTRFQLESKINDSDYYGIITGLTPVLSHPIETFYVSDDNSYNNFFYVDESKIIKDEDQIEDVTTGLRVGQEVSLNIDSAYLSSYLEAGDEVLTKYIEEYPVLKQVIDRVFNMDGEQITILNLLDHLTKEDGHNVLRDDVIELKATITGAMSFPENIQKASYSTSSYLMSKSIFRNAVETLISDNFTTANINLGSLSDLITNDDLETIVMAVFKDALNWGDGSDTELKDETSFPGANEYLVKFADQSTLETKEEAIEAYYDSKGDNNNLAKILDRSLNPWSVVVDMEVSEALNLALVFPIVFFLVAILVILTTSSELVAKERTIIGTMKAIGLSKLQIYWHYISLVLCLVGISCVLGCVLGPIVLPVIMSAKYDLLYSLPARSFFVFPWWQAILTVVVFLGLAALATYACCRREIRLLPAESMRSKGATFKGRSAKSGKKEGPLKLSTKMAFRNIRVNKVKSAMVVIGVAGCTALLICGFGIDDTLNHCVDNDMTLYYGTSIFITYTTNQHDDVPSYMESVLEDYPDAKVDQYFSYGNSSMSSEEAEYDGTFRMFSDDHPYFKAEIPKGTVAISNKVADTLKVEVGDKITFTYGATTFEDITIGNIYEAFYFHGVAGLASDDIWQDEFTSKYTSAYLDLGDDATAEEMLSIKTLLMNSYGYLSSMQTWYETNTKISDTLSGISMMTLAVKIFAILLAIVVLYNLALLNFTERTRDIATLKVCGFSKGEITLSLMLETLSLTAVGFIFGALLGYPFMSLVLYVNRVSLVEYLYAITPLTYVYAFIIVFIFAFIINFILAQMSGRVKMVESLKSVE